MRTRIKICGITRLQDAIDAVSLGVDALGFVFATRSPRLITVHNAVEIVEQLPPFISTVALFMNNSRAEIEAVVQAKRFSLLQFHGDETPEECERYGMPYIKAVPMGGGADPVEYMARYRLASGFLVDSHASGEMGGSGLTFRWDIMPASDKPLILAGGLTAENVGQAIQQVRPYAVDISSGVEASKGIKDLNKMRAFVRAVVKGDL